jgi:peptidyl-dipeptidase A
LPSSAHSRSPPASARPLHPAPAPGAPAAAPAGETADQFVARVNEEFRAISAELNAAQWLSNTYINGDSEMLAAKANERWLTQLNAWIAQAKRFEGQQLSPDTARAIKLLKLIDRDAGAEGPGQTGRTHRHRNQDGRHVRRRQVLPRPARRTASAAT